jgi:hypothetical protein
MGASRAVRVFPGSLQEVETGWYDTSRWPAWVDGLDRIVSVGGEWPREGGLVTWKSGPAGRGTVTERVTSYEELVGQTLQVQDEAISGHQAVSFTATADGVEVQLTLDYSLRQGSFIAPLIDFMFVKREMTRSLVRTLTRFGAALATRSAPGPASPGDEGH